MKHPAHSLLVTLGAGAELCGDPDESTCQPISGTIDTRIGRRE